MAHHVTPSFPTKSLASALVLEVHDVFVVTIERISMSSIDSRLEPSEKTVRDAAC